MLNRKRNGGPAKRIIMIVCLLAVAGQSTAEDGFTPVYRPTLEVSPASGKIEVDGQLSDAGWRGAAVADNFAEHQPGDQTKPPVNTEALVTYDNDNLYVAFICHDDPATIRASLCDRDRVFSDDNICLLIDTYGDAAWAYEFNVNPYGVQGDLLWSANYGEDSRYDMIWHSAGLVTDSGYQLEIAIPFSSMRFPNTPEQTWKMDFWRNHPRDIRRQYSWAALDRNEPCWPCQWGTVTGIRDVSPGKGIEFLPTVIGYQAGALTDMADVDSDFDNADPDGEMSLGVKYALASNAMLEATYNPDFSQIESDHAQIDVNTTFALSYSEKRPFFQEGSDLFNTPYNIVYTRLLNDPDFAAKMTARLGKTSVAYLGAHDVHSPVIIPYADSSSLLLTGKSTSNIFRVQHTFRKDSRIGLVATDRRFEGGGEGLAYGTDGRFWPAKNLRFTWQVMSSYTEEPDDTLLTENLNDYVFDGTHTAGFDGESFYGHAIYSQLAYDARDVWWSASYSQLSPTFRADNGFMTGNDYRMVTTTGEYLIRTENSSLIEYFEPGVNGGMKWDWNGVRKDEWFRFNFSTQFRVAQAYTHAQYMRSAEKFLGTDYNDIWNWHICFNARPNDLLAFGGHYDYGNRIARRNETMGRETNIGLWLDIKPADRILIENWLDFARSKETDTDIELFSGYIYRTRLSYQITRPLSLRLVVQYNDFGDCWDIDPLLTYRINSFSVFYLGSTWDYQIYDGLGSEADDTRTRLASRQFFCKLQYLFQL